MSDARERIATCRLYLVCDASFDGVAEAITGGVDVVQLRDRSLDDGALLGAARAFCEQVHAAGALFLVNDRPDLALLARADGVHLGQRDLPAQEVRALIGDGMILGLSTHSAAEIDAVPAVADYIGVGPVHATPTKPGRPAVGLELVRHAAAHARLPWFAIGGIDASTAPAAVADGARRLAVVRAIAGARDPRAAAASLRALLD